jgi:hypothetical protein
MGLEADGLLWVTWQVHPDAGPDMGTTNGASSSNDSFNETRPSNLDSRPSNLDSLPGSHSLTRLDRGLSPPACVSFRLLEHGTHLTPLS